MARGKGCINVTMFDGNSWNENHLVDILYVPKLKYNLFSVSGALDNGLKLQSTKDTCELMRNGRPVTRGIRQGKFFVMQRSSSMKNRREENIYIYKVRIKLLYFIIGQYLTNLYIDRSQIIFSTYYGKSSENPPV